MIEQQRDNWRCRCLAELMTVISSALEIKRVRVRSSRRELLCRCCRCCRCVAVVVYVFVRAVCLSMDCKRNAINWRRCVCHEQATGSSGRARLKSERAAIESIASNRSPTPITATLIGDRIKEFGCVRYKNSLARHHDAGCESNLKRLPF